MVWVKSHFKSLVVCSASPVDLCYNMCCFFTMTLGKQGGQRDAEDRQEVQCVSVCVSLAEYKWALSVVSEHVSEVLRHNGKLFLTFEGSCINLKVSATKTVRLAPAPLNRTVSPTTVTLITRGLFFELHKPLLSNALQQGKKTVQFDALFSIFFVSAF